jgi:hypothetical protein
LLYRNEPPDYETVSFNTTTDYSTDDQSDVEAPAGLPDDMFAKSADECDTLLYIYPEYYHDFDYGSVTEAYAAEYYLRVINVKERTRYPDIKIGETHPPQAFSYNSREGQTLYRYYAGIPFDVVIKYIKGLPVR